MLRDRIIELRRVKASTLRPHPQNWRTHPQHQKEVLQGVLAEVGMAAALLARELPDGSLQLIDGHLRAETLPEETVPVLVLDVDAAEAQKLLASLDPLAALAARDQAALDALLAEMETASPALEQMLADLQAGNGSVDSKLPTHQREATLPTAWQVLVECESESEQRELYQRLTAERYEVKVITM